jgi:hypothetical protein
MIPRGLAAGAIGLCLGLAAIQLRAADIRIDRIEKFGTNQVLIHFETEADYKYTLQATDHATNGVPAGAWKTIYQAPSFPFPNHHVAADYRTNRQRFYRLSAVYSP